MTWKIEFLPQAEKTLGRLSAQSKKRIVKFLFERLAILENPRTLGDALHGREFAGLWKYRVGDFRVICRIEDETISILVVKIGNRRDIYKAK